MKNPNKKLWEGHGVFSPEAQAVCDEMMGAMLRLGAKHPEALRVVVQAALFELLELPKRTPEAQAKMRWKPPRRGTGEGTKP